MSSPVPMDHEEQRIREAAYHLWEKDGCPPGQSERYWEMARNMAGDLGKPTVGASSQTASYPGEQESLAGQIKKVARGIGIFPRRPTRPWLRCGRSDVLRGVRRRHGPRGKMTSSGWPFGGNLSEAEARSRRQREPPSCTPLLGYRPAMHPPSEARANGSNGERDRRAKYRAPRRPQRDLVSPSEILGLVWNFRPSGM